MSLLNRIDQIGGWLINWLVLYPIFLIGKVVDNLHSRWAGCGSKLAKVYRHRWGEWIDENGNTHILTVFHWLKFYQGESMWQVDILAIANAFTLDLHYVSYQGVLFFGVNRGHFFIGVALGTFPRILWPFGAPDDHH